MRVRPRRREERTMRAFSSGRSPAFRFALSAVAGFAAAVAVTCMPERVVAETVLITGANSGIGLEFARQYAAKGWTTIATHRRRETPETLAELVAEHPN